VGTTVHAKGGTVLGTARRVVKKGSKLAGRAVSQVGLATSEIPGGDTIPLRRIGFGVSMVMDPRGSTLLDVLGDDLDERAHTLDRFLNRCTDEEVNQLLAAFQEAAARRGARRAQAAT
jgi:hypothetical protein